MKLSVIKSFVFVFAISSLGLMSLAPREARGVTAEVQKQLDEEWKSTQDNNAAYQKGYDEGKAQAEAAAAQVPEDNGCCGGMGI